MRLILLLLFNLFLLSNCTKPKTVLICGNHVCVNKTEAKQYFEENLTIEVKLVDKKKSLKPDLIELNLRQNAEGDKEVNVYSKETLNENIKVLSNVEIDEIKKNIQKKKNKQTISKKVDEKKSRKKVIRSVKEKKIKKKNIKISSNNGSAIKNKNIDVCAVIENCSIDQISKYLIEQGKRNKFPDITTRQ